MNRDTIYFLPENGEPTFSRDDSLAKLPLPKLEDTLARYYRAIQPFGSKEELKNSEKIIQDFKNGQGKKLQLLLEQHEKKHRNWVSFKFELVPKSNHLTTLELLLIKNSTSVTLFIYHNTNLMSYSLG